MNKNEISTQTVDVSSGDSADIALRQFELEQRQAVMYAKSNLVPDAYRNKVENVMIAMQMARQMKANVLMVMQNLYIVKGNPAWSAKFMIACFNACGKFSSIDYNFNEEKTECFASCVEYSTGIVKRGPTVSMKIAEKEGWLKSGSSKWHSIPELMMRYRSASWMIRSLAPELTMGFLSKSEVDEVNTVQGTVVPKTVNLNQIMDAISDNEKEIEPAEELESKEKSTSTDQSGALFPSEGNYE